MRASRDIEQELEDMRTSIIALLNRPHALEFIDLDYIAGQIYDLKQELRMSKAREGVKD